MSWCSPGKGLLQMSPRETVEPLARGEDEAALPPAVFAKPQAESGPGTLHLGMWLGPWNLVPKPQLS